MALVNIGMMTFPLLMFSLMNFKTASVINYRKCYSEVF